MQGNETLDALALAERVRSGEMSAAEVLEATIARIEQRDGALNAVVTRLFDEARATVARGLPTGPFMGVPFLVKELVASVAGTATSSSSRLYAHSIASTDSEIVARMRRAGLVIVGKSSSPEFGLSPVTESALFGVTRNPWDPALSPGGSSGGSAAAVAAGMVPMAHATDGGGSIRIPASACGLFGLKPTRARVTAGPEGGEGLSGLACQHAVSRSVRDSAALLDAIAGPMPGDPYSAPPPGGTFLAATRREPAPLRIAFSTRAPNGAPVDAACTAAVHDAARLCAALGHHVEEAAPDYDAHAMSQGFETVFACNTLANVTRASGGAMPAEGLIEPLTRALAERGRAVDARSYILTLQRLQRESRRVALFFERHDVWLTPTLAQTPRPIGWFGIDRPDAETWLRQLEAYVPFTYLFNITGQPAASMPLHWANLNGQEIPIGVQFAARTGEEELLFSLAAQLEQARPWMHRRPPARP